MDNNNNNNDNNKSNPPPSNQKDPPPAETSKIVKNNKGNDDKAKFDHKEDSSGSANSTKPGAFAVKSGDKSKIKNRRGEIPLDSKDPVDRAEVLPGHNPKNEEPGFNVMKDKYQEKIDKKKFEGGTKVTAPGVKKVQQSVI